MIRFDAPEWLLLAPALVVCGILFRNLRLGLGQPVRMLILGLFVLLMARPEFRRLGDGLELSVLVDRSASAADAMARQLPEWEMILNRSMGASDRLRFIDFASTPVVRSDGTESGLGSSDATNFRLAIEFALATQSGRQAARILALTDGFSTETLGGIGEVLARQDVALDFRLPTPIEASDYGIDVFRTPTRVDPGEPFLVDLGISGYPDGDVPFELTRDGVIVQSGVVRVSDGRAGLRFTDRADGGGGIRYRVQLAVNDAVSGNNTAESWTGIDGRSSVVLITSYVDDPLVRPLRESGLNLTIARNPSEAGIGLLAGARAVILNNVAAPELPVDFLEALDFYVRSQGGGLMMVGGRASFGAGGYFGSAIDELLPVSMELRTEHRKLAAAMAIVMDRSGSMGARVSGGLSKMDLANEGAARAIELLGPSDAVAVFAVDTTPHTIVPLSSLESNRESLVDSVRRIQPGGGGIYVFNGLKAAWDQLRESDAGQRHVILFADAADAEQAGEYISLISEMQAGGATVSVIGLGTDTDTDAPLLRDIAGRGGGRIFFNQDASGLPALFEQETVAVARSAFIDELTGVEPTTGWLEIAAHPLEWLSAVDGYNLSYLRPGATAAAFSRDEYAAPLVAFWQRGSGRTAAVAFPMGGEHSQAVRDWVGYGAFSQTLARWLAGDEMPPGLGLQTRIDGSTLVLDLRFDDEWQDRFASNAPTILTTNSTSDAAREAVWERQSPGHYRARIELLPGKPTRGAIQAGQFTIPFGPMVSGINPEWMRSRDRIEELKAAAQLSGGTERVDLAEVWKSPRREAFQDIQRILLVMLVLTFLADALLTRLGASPRLFPRRRRTTPHSA